MAQPLNSFSTYDARGIREDLSDIIYNVDPTETPFFQMAGKAKATNTFHEWQTDTLAAASAANAVIEGDDTEAEASTPTVRIGNYCQISRKTARITGTQDAVKKAGRDKEMAYQLVKRTKELRRDMEASLLQNGARVAGDDGTPRQLAGVRAWIATNTSAGVGGTDPNGLGTNTRGAGTQRAFTESLLKNVIQEAWSSGGNPDTLMVGPFNKQAVSGFTGGSTRFDKGEDKKLYASIDMYESDFGTISVVPNRFQLERDAFLLQKDMWAVAMLRPVKQEELAKTGDSEARLIIVEYTLESRNERASGIIADLTTS